MKTADGQKIFAPAESFDSYKELKVAHDHIMNSSGQLWNWPMVATLSRPSLARILYLNNLYEKILSVPGVICEFGVHYGSTTAILTNMRALKEPYNYSRIIYTFDTFTGFVNTSKKDGTDNQDGDFAISSDYAPMLDKILTAHEQLAFNNQAKKHHIYVGDAAENFKKFTEESPEKIISMAIFDMDIYQPTLEILNQIVPFLTRGSLLVFDELNCEHFPGETIALKEVFGTEKLKLQRDPNMPFCSWTVWE